MPDRIAVVGAGQMGNGIAHVCALSGLPVVMINVAASALAAAQETIARNLDRQVKKDMVTVAQRDAALRRLSTTTSLDGVAGAAIVIEAASENRDLKFRLFEQMDAMADPGAILASNTSSIAITELGAHTKRAGQVIGMHFMNPVPVMKLVEIIRGLATSDATARRVVELARSLDKTPVEVNDSPGFVSNRVLLPMINEAIGCVMEGVGTPDAVDQVMTLGMGHPLGPLALADLIGLDTCLAILEVMHDGLGDPRYRPSPLLRKYVAAGWLGRKSGRGFYRYDAAGKRTE